MDGSTSRASTWPVVASKLKSVATLGFLTFMLLQVVETFLPQYEDPPIYGLRPPRAVADCIAEKNHAVVTGSENAGYEVEVLGGRNDFLSAYEIDSFNGRTRVIRVRPRDQLSVMFVSVGHCLD